MSLDVLISSWQEVRAGLIDEAETIPADQFTFKATPDMRSVAGILQHVVEAQKTLIGEVCRADTNLFRQSFPDQIKTYAPGVSDIHDKERLIDLLRQSMDDTESRLREAGNELQSDMKRFDGKEIAKYDFLASALAHEMYHRGQFTVYLRLLGIEPVLTKRLRKIFEPQKASA
ncbi:MAG: DinB family protein [Pyrinomonadaceae bacterium]